MHINGAGNIARDRVECRRLTLGTATITTAWRLGALWARALRVRVLDSDRDLKKRTLCSKQTSVRGRNLTIELELRPIGELEHVHLLNSHQVHWVLEIAEQVAVERAAVRVQHFETVLSAIGHSARVYCHAESVLCMCEFR